MKRLLFVINSLVALGTLFLFVAAYIPPSKLGYFSGITLFTPVALAANFIFVLFWGIRLNKKALLSIIILLINFAGILKFVNFNFLSGSSNENGESIKLMSYNAHGFSTPKIRKDFHTKVLNLIDKEKPDIVVLQETMMNEKLKKCIQKYKYHNKININNGGYSDVILTDYEIINSGHVNLHYESAKNYAPFADIVIEKDTVRIYNIHLASFKFSQDPEVLKNTSRKGMIKRLNTISVHQENQVETLKKHFLKSPYPIIIMGDFNNNAFSYIHRKLLKYGKLKDSYVEAGKGFGSSFDFSYFPTRIDFILVPEATDVLTHKVVRTKKWSDHYPIFSEIKFKE